MKRMTLRNRFIVTSYLSIVLSVVLISIVSYALLSSNSRKFAIRAATDLVQQKNGEMKTKMRGLEVTIRDIIYSRELQSLLSNQDEEEDNLYLRRTAINQSIARASNSLYMIDNIAIFTSDGMIAGSMFEFDTLRTADSYPWYEAAVNSNGETVWLSDTVMLVSDNYGPHMAVSAVKKIRSVYDADFAKLGETLGYVYFTMNLDTMFHFSQLEYSNQGREVYVVTADSRVLGGSDQQGRGTVLAEGFLEQGNNHQYISCQGQTYLYTYEEMDRDLGWYMICLTKQAVILKDARTAIGVCAGFSVVLLAAFYYLSMRNAESVSRPIKLLEQEFEMVEQGEFNIEIQQQTGIREVDNLFSRFHVMAYRLDNLIHEVYEVRIKEQALIGEARQAQLHALQMQINPHFLYNTLDSINWMALMEGNQDVSKMILALGHLFRSNINTSGLYIIARKEAENVKLYMFLEKVRHGGKLTYDIIVEPDGADGVILRNIIQPLVENSIKYGIESFDMEGHIRIQIRRQGPVLSILVGDNGRGMDGATLKSLRALWEHIAAEKEMETGEKRGVGIRNIMRRLWLCYGKEAGFRIDSSPEGGTEMELSFPFRVKGADDEII